MIHLSLTAVLVSNYIIISIVYYDVVMSTLDCARVACIYSFVKQVPDELRNYHCLQVYLVRLNGGLEALHIFNWQQYL